MNWLLIIRIAFVFVNLNSTTIMRRVIKIHSLIDILNRLIILIGTFIGKAPRQLLLTKPVHTSELLLNGFCQFKSCLFVNRGLDITFTSSTDSSFGGILIRSIENKQTGQIHEGSCLVVDAILNHSESKTIQELVEIRMKSNLDVFDGTQLLFLRSAAKTTVEQLMSSARVGLTLKVPSIDRERFLFRSYRFTPNEYFPSKMKMTIVLAHAAMKYFESKTNEKKWTDYANDIAIQSHSRLAVITSNLRNLQSGYDTDISCKTSALVDFHKKTMTNADISRAYGIWLRKYRPIS
jgi:hypothetical protein